jgi:hypothetical protein
LAGSSFAQTPQVNNAGTDATRAGPMLTEAEIKAKYRTCPRGYYSGPQPGKARYTKDHFTWAVTPDFAAKFCLPQEFIDPQLKSVEAVAYRILRNDDEETCGWGGNRESCSTPTAHRFEIYYPSGLIPKSNDASFFHSTGLGSKFLITMSDAEFGSAVSSAKRLKREGAIHPFPEKRISLAYSEKGLLSAISGVAVKQYFQEVFEGTDYLAVETSTGFTAFGNWKSNPQGRQLALIVQKPRDIMIPNRVRPDDLSLIIYLPDRMFAQVLKNDGVAGENMKSMMQQTIRSDK